MSEVSNRLFKFEQRIIALEEAQAVLKDKVFTLEFVRDARDERWRWYKFWQKS